jgi:AraC-like DNA-binding protein
MGNIVLDRFRGIPRGVTTLSFPLGRNPLPAMPTSAGYDVQTGSEYSWNGLKRGQTPFAVLQYTISGQGNLRYEDKVHRVREGELMLVLIPHNHRYWVDDGGRWEFFWITMNGDEALRLLAATVRAAGPVLCPKARAVDILANGCLRMIAGEGALPGEASALAYRAVMALYDDVFAGRHADDADDRPMAPVIRHIVENVRSDLRIEELASIAGLSRAHFSRLFTALEGCPPSEFVMAERMRQAAKLLALGTGTSVKEVAVLTGFADPNYFAKVFRRFFGASPTEFRTTGMYAAHATGNRPSGPAER